MPERSKEVQPEVAYDGELRLRSYYQTCERYYQPFRNRDGRYFASVRDTLRRIGLSLVGARVPDVGGGIGELPEVLRPLEPVLDTDQGGGDLDAASGMLADAAALPRPNREAIAHGR